MLRVGGGGVRDSRRADGSDGADADDVPGGGGRGEGVGAEHGLAGGGGGGGAVPHPTVVDREALILLLRLH